MSALVCNSNSSSLIIRPMAAWGGCQSSQVIPIDGIVAGTVRLRAYGGGEGAVFHKKAIVRHLRSKPQGDDGMHYPCHVMGPGYFTRRLGQSEEGLQPPGLVGHHGRRWWCLLLL